MASPEAERSRVSKDEQSSALNTDYFSMNLQTALPHLQKLLHEYSSDVERHSNDKIPPVALSSQKEISTRNDSLIIPLELSSSAPPQRRSPWLRPPGQSQEKLLNEIVIRETDEPIDKTTPMRIGKNAEIKTVERQDKAAILPSLSIDTFNKDTKTVLEKPFKEKLNADGSKELTYPNNNLLTSSSP